MSWDIDIMMKGIDGKYYLVEEIGNITYNVNPMYTKALGIDSFSDFLDGKQCGEINKQLSDGVMNMKVNKEEYVKLNPENRWDNYETALKYLTRLTIACNNNALGIIMVN